MNYWLMKSEPDVFGIEDLEMRSVEGSFWDGVRNYQARNYLRAMKKGDLAFFYHSSCLVPGVVGVMRVVAEAEVDPSQFDPQSPYHDSASRMEAPRWSGVRVVFVEKWPIVPLTELRQVDSLKGLPLLVKGNRLSVMPVSPEEWQVIRGLALK